MNQIIISAGPFSNSGPHSAREEAPATGHSVPSRETVTCSTESANLLGSGCLDLECIISLNDRDFQNMLYLITGISENPHVNR